MSDDQTKSRSSAVTWLVAVGAIFLLYVLSTAPVAKLYDFGYLKGWPPAIYTPVIYVCDKSETARKFLEWYFDVWREIIPPPPVPPPSTVELP